MADLLHLPRATRSRSAFFPPDTAAPPVERARAEDFEEIRELAGLRDHPDERSRIAAWAQRLPHRFSVARGPEGEVVAALVDAEPGKIDERHDLEFARDRREIVVEGRAVELTPLEAQVLGEMIDRAPSVVRREDLIERIWEGPMSAATSSIRCSDAAQKAWFQTKLHSDGPQIRVSLRPSRGDTAERPRR